MFISPPSPVGDQEEDRRKAREAGFDSHFTRLLSPEGLHDLLVTIEHRMLSANGVLHEGGVCRSSRHLSSQTTSSTVHARPQCRQGLTCRTGGRNANAESTSPSTLPLIGKKSPRSMRRPWNGHSPNTRRLWHRPAPFTRLSCKKSNPSSRIT